MFLKWYAICTIPTWALITIAALRSSTDDWLNTCAGIVGALWILSVIYILAKMVLVHSYRESLLAKIFQQSIADEREMIISGNASKKTYFFSASIILVLLFISVFKISISFPTKDERDLGKKESISFFMFYF